MSVLSRRWGGPAPGNHGRHRWEPSAPDGGGEQLFTWFADGDVAGRFHSWMKMSAASAAALTATSQASALLDFVCSVQPGAADGVAFDGGDHVIEGAAGWQAEGLVEGEELKGVGVGSV
jgi:hypothetical protein